MQELLDAIQKNPLLSSAIAFAFSLLGLWVGNWQAVNRDRRKEFNAVAERVRPILEKQLEDVTPYSNHPDPDDLTRLSYMLPRWRRSRYLAAVREYKAARQQSRADEVGQAYYPDSTAIQDAAKTILRHLSYR